MAPSEIYETLPANHIRILKLLPGQKYAKIQCSLAVVPLSLHDDATLKYEALSYMWGLDEPTHLIKLSGQQFVIRKNLFTVLKIL